MSLKRVAWVGLSLALLGALVMGSSVAAATAPSTSYTVSFKEVGLAAGTSWSVTFNSATLSSTGSEINFTSVTSAGYWSTTSTVAGSSSTNQYATSFTSGYMYLPSQLAVTITYVHEYQVAFATSPASSGSTTPYGTNWFVAGSETAIVASPNVGFVFNSWKSSTTHDTLDNKSSPSTVLTVNAAGTITAKFKAHPTKFSFDEVGLPSGTSWTAVFSSTSYGSSTSTVTTTPHPAGSYSWSVASISAAHNVEYVPSPASGYVNLPGQPSQEIVFTKEFSVSFAVSPTSSGSISPSSTAYYANGTQLVVNGYDSGSYVFSSWSSTGTVGFLNKLAPSTTANINSTSTITAKFVSGTPCSANCTVAFTELGLPSGATWDLSVGGLNHLSSKSTITFTNQTAGISWGALSYISPANSGSSVMYYPTQTSGYWYFGETTAVTIVYQKYVYVNFVDAPSGYGTGITLGSNWYLAGTPYAVSAGWGNQVAFHGWSANVSGITFSSPKASSTSVVFNAPGTVYANYNIQNEKLTFEAFNLPKGTIWGIAIAGLYYTTSARELNVTLPAGTYYYTPIGSIAGVKAGVAYSPTSYYYYVNAPAISFTTVVYQTYYDVAWTAGGTAGGSLYGGSSSGWELAGTVLSLDAINGTSVSFVSWSAVTSSGTIAINAPSQASTYATVNGPGTITAKFA